MESRYLYASITASGQLYFDAPRNLTIKGVLFSAMCTSNSVSDYVEFELSAASTNQTAVNDALNVIAIANFGSIGGGTPASTSLAAPNAYCPADAPVKAGERVYFNYTESGTATWRVRCLVWFT